MNIWYRSSPNTEWQWCADVTDGKAHEFADRKNEMFQGSWYVARDRPDRSVEE